MRVILLTPCGEEVEMSVPDQFRLLGVRMPSPVRLTTVEIDDVRTRSAYCGGLPETYRPSGLSRRVNGVWVEIWTVDGYGRHLDRETAAALGFRCATP